MLSNAGILFLNLSGSRDITFEQRRTIAVSETHSKSLFFRLAPMVLVALVLRLIVVGFLYPERLNPDRDDWRFAGETGRIADSIAEGKGFNSPLFGDTGRQQRPNHRRSLPKPQAVF